MTGSDVGYCFSSWNASSTSSVQTKGLNFYRSLKNGRAHSASLEINQLSATKHPMSTCGQWRGHHRGDRALALRSSYGGRHGRGSGTTTRTAWSLRSGARSSLPVNLLLTARGTGGGKHGTNVQHGVEACQMSKWFYDTSTDTATRAACCGSLLEGLRSLEFTAMDEARWIRGFYVVQAAGV
jgi:hypothetical protein